MLRQFSLRGVLAGVYGPWKLPNRVIAFNKTQRISYRVWVKKTHSKYSFLPRIPNLILKDIKSKEFQMNNIKQNGWNI